MYSLISSSDACSPLSIIWFTIQKLPAITVSRLVASLKLHCLLTPVRNDRLHPLDLGRSGSETPDVYGP